MTRTLEGISSETLCKAFNKAFSDYQINTVMSENQLENNLKKNGFSPVCSIGLFDEEQLVGFVLNGKRKNQGYDCGTGIIPAYRGKGYAHTLVETAKKALTESALDVWVLEVLCENLRAKKLYEKAGFTTKRYLNCYSTPIEKLRTQSKVALKEQSYFSIPEGECIPSWQNSTDSMATGLVPVWDIFYNDTRCGVFCFIEDTGSIAQLYIYPQYRSKGIAKQTIIEGANHCKAKTLSVSNVDASYTPLNNLFSQLGFSLFTVQAEMTCPLGKET